MSQTIYSLTTANSYAWNDLGVSIATGKSVRIRTSGAIRFTPGGTNQYSFCEGTYPDAFTSTHSFRPQDRQDWIKWTRQHGTWLAVNVDVPLGLCVAFKGTGGPVPSLEWTKAFNAWHEISGRDRVFMPEEMWWSAGGYPPPYTMYVGLNDIDANGAAAPDAMTLTLDVEDDGLGGTEEGDEWYFKWAKAYDAWDRVNGGFCQETGYWAPERCLVEVNGRRVIDWFAERPERDYGLK